jgi:hypothetical protein
MFDDTNGLYIQRLTDGKVRIVVRKDATPGAEILFDVILTATQWSRAVASVVRDCKDCQAYFIAYSQHMGTDPTDKDEE